MSNSKTIYLGSGRKQSDTWIKGSINIDKLEPHIEEYKGTRFVRININIKDHQDQFGKDVNITLDQFEPNQVQDQVEDRQDQVQKVDRMIDENDDDDLPF